MLTNPPDQVNPPRKPPQNSAACPFGRGADGGSRKRARIQIA
jgi:hypothetical protein